MNVINSCKEKLVKRSFCSRAFVPRCSAEKRMHVGYLALEGTMLPSHGGPKPLARDPSVRWDMRADRIGKREGCVYVQIDENTIKLILSLYERHTEDATLTSIGTERDPLRGRRMYRCSYAQ